MISCSSQISAGTRSRRLIGHGDRHQLRQRVGNFDAREALHAFHIANGDGQVQAEV